MKQIRIKVLNPLNSIDTIVYLSERETLLEALVRSQLTIPNECGGIGTCGKCAVRVMEGALEITSQDKEIFSDSELLMGYRLACMACPDTDSTIMLLSDINGNYKVVTDTGSNLTNEKHNNKESQVNNLFDKADEGYAIAIDIGTTTLALALVALPGTIVLDKYTAINPQRVYGADVVSRIKVSNEGKQEVLSQLVREEILRGILVLTKKQQIRIGCITKITISGNTTMIHLLMGYSCGGLGAYPFKPINLKSINTFTNDIFAIDEKIPISILPGISVFVGGDITAGLIACGIDLEEKPCLFIDLGTNGEMALGNRERILVTSTAAGPAFEGGNISCGVGSIPGAICHVSLEGEHLTYETIDRKSAVGLCGTGVIELTAQLLKKDIIDNTGLLMDPYFDSGYPIADMKFIQKDIRELQLAKAAIRAGVEILIKNYGISYEQLDRVYLAGGFGYHLDIDNAIRIGLLPKATMYKARGVGNTSLSGAVYAMLGSEVYKRMDHIVSVAQEIHLSNDEEFNDLFIQYISF